MQLGRLLNSKDKPLGFKWIKCSTGFLGNYLSYDQKRNDYLKFKKLQTNFKIFVRRGTSPCSKSELIANL